MEHLSSGSTARPMGIMGRSMGTLAFLSTFSLLINNLFTNTSCSMSIILLNDLSGFSFIIARIPSRLYPILSVRTIKKLFNHHRDKHHHMKADAYVL